MKLTDIDVVILAGGLGTRVSHLLKDTPKPMALLEGRPFLEWLILLLKKSGFKNIVLSIGYLGEKIQDYFDDGTRWGLNISYAFEAIPLGTGGAIKHSLSKTTSNPVIVINGDSILLLDYRKLLRFHAKNKSDITIGSKKVADKKHYGAIIYDRSSRIISFKEKPFKSENGWINGGIYVCQRNIFDGIRIKKGTSFENDLLPRLLSKNMYAFRVTGRFLDIGTPESFKKANAFIRYFKENIIKR